MRDTATSLALQVEQSVQRDSIELGEIRVVLPELLCLYIALDGLVGVRGDSKASKETRPSKALGTARLLSE